VLVDVLGDLVRRLRDRGIPGSIRLVGAAAIALAYDQERPATRDVDAYLHPTEPILDVAAEIAAERGWKRDWLNTKAVIFQSHYDDPTIDWPLVLQEGEVKLSVASPELLAMKLLASRGSRDADDIATLLRVCRVTSLEEAQAILHRYYPDEDIKPQGRRVIDAWLRGEQVHSD
jgi:hypothetical protein